MEEKVMGEVGRREDRRGGSEVRRVLDSVV